MVTINPRDKPGLILMGGYSGQVIPPFEFSALPRLSPVTVWKLPSFILAPWNRAGTYSLMGHCAASGSGLQDAAVPDPSTWRPRRLRPALKRPGRSRPQGRHSGDGNVSASGA